MHRRRRCSVNHDSGPEFVDIAAAVVDTDITEFDYNSDHRSAESERNFTNSGSASNTVNDHVTIQHHESAKPGQHYSAELGYDISAALFEPV